MADDKTSNGVPGRSDLDPFAELTKIMGFDPRVPIEQGSAQAREGTSEAPAKQDEFGIDLERELLGQTDAGQAADPASNAAPKADAGKDELAAATDIDLDLVEDEINEHVDAFLSAAADPVEPPQAAAEDDVPSSSIFAIESPAEAAALAEEVDDVSSGDPETAVDDWEPKPFLGAHPVEDLDTVDDASMADVDMDFSTELVAAETNDTPEMTEKLEAEYNELLGNAAEAEQKAEPVAAPSEKAAVAAKVDEAAQRRAAIITGKWRAAELDEVETRPATPASARSEASAFGNAAAATDLDDDLAAALAQDDLAASAKPAPAASTTPDDPFAVLAAMAAKYQNSNSDTAWRSTASRYEPAPAVAPVVSAAPAQRLQPAVARPTNPSAFAPRSPAPAIETVDVQDDAIALADDLDLPEIGYDEPPAADPYDDLDAEFNNLLNQMSTGEKRAATPASMRAEPQYAPAQRYPAYVEQRAAQTTAARPTQPAPAAARQYDDEDFAKTDDDYFEEAMASFDPDDDGANDFEPMSPPVVEQRPRRGLMIAAIVGGLALVGGIGAVAMSLGSNDKAEISLVKADPKPVKVRPENPGGAAAPSKENSVYDTVSRSASNGAPTQETLVNNAEEPVDLPAPDDEPIDEAADIDKIEDRVPATQEASAAQPDGSVAVEPRKVRTMVVKSDGSLVPATSEEAPPAQPAAAVQPAPQVPAEPATQAPVAAKPETATQPSTENITTGATEPAPGADETVAAITPPPAGSWAVQVSSQPSEDGANKSMKDISRKYASVIGDRGANVVKADVAGKGTFWRVRIPAGSREEAINLCGDLKAAGGSCFVTK